jgi:hypothetical protein
MLQVAKSRFSLRRHTDQEKDAQLHAQDAKPVFLQSVSWSPSLPKVYNICRTVYMEQNLEADLLTICARSTSSIFVVLANQTQVMNWTLASITKSVLISHLLLSVSW